MTEAITDMQRFFMAEGQLDYTSPLPERLIDASFVHEAVDQLGPYMSAAAGESSIRRSRSSFSWS